MTVIKDLQLATLFFVFNHEIAEKKYEKVAIEAI